MAESAPKTEDYTRWATGRTPRHAPHLPGPPRIPRDSGMELVSNPFTQNVKATGATGASLFRDSRNHPDAVGTVLNHAATLANFFPARGLEDQTEQFSNYIMKVSSFPGFMLTLNEPTGQKQTTPYVNMMIDDIKRSYDGVVDADANKVASSVKAMANSIINKSSRFAYRSLFTQMSIMGGSDDSSLYLTIFYTTLNMEVEDGKKTYSSPQSYRINRSVFKVLTASLVTNADQLFELLGNGSFDQWVKGATSPGGTKLSCFEELHIGAEKEM
ncbi:hypothetical protein DFQ27_004254 [Actinomortierella ambigua]|uniref:Uncharacterized protein n=1 Tax=Actinomortierella ambigua TaxID=1343610 RepID=A0A9P6U4A9_9FUNG|nr:hypothetical protein DFQ27_004254 [Actinomortierella ambigua]